MKRLITATAFVAVAAFAFATGQGEGGDFDYNGIEQLEVEAETFEVVVTSIRGRNVGMDIENPPDGYTVRHSVSGSTVRVWVERDFSLFSRPHRGRLVFRIPAAIDVNVDTSTGSVEIAGPIDGSLRVNTSTGSIDANSIRADAELRSTTGSIEITEVSGDLRVTSTTGSIEVRRMNGNLSVRSSTGSQYLDEIEGDIDARSTTGRIEISDTEGRVNLHTSTGDQIGSDVTLTGDSRFEATTGSVEMNLTNDLNAIGFDLSSTTGSLEVGSERSQRRLFIGSTGMTVSGSTSTGSQRYR